MKTRIYIIYMMLFAAAPLANGQRILATQLEKGKIRFASQHIDQHNMGPADFLETYTLTNKSNLFFVADLGQPATKYMQALEADLSIDELIKMGNFQFTILIDDQKIYESNLLSGAPSKDILQNAVLLQQPLIDINGNGIWSESFWNRFLYRGGNEALTEGPHKLRMEIRVYINNGIEKVSDLIADGELKIMVNRKPKIDNTNQKLTRLKPYNDLEISNDTFDIDKIKMLKALVDTGVFKKINSLIVLKEGKLLIEEYFNGEERNTLHNPRSVGKSFASTITGLAIKEGFIEGVNQELQDFYNLEKFENYVPEKENINIKDLLTMSSSFEGNDSDYESLGNEENMYPTDDWVKFTLDLPITKRDKSNWRYFTAGVVVLGDILEKSVPGGLEKYADEKLFKPLGIQHYEWEHTPQNVANTAGGIRLRAIDFAKYGQLYKNKGFWNGRQIISKEWVEESFTKQVQISDRENEYYGYLFWNKNFGARGKSYEAFYSAGNGGNYIIVFKDQPLVIVVTASAYGMPYAHPQVNEMLEKYILPALIP